MKYGTKVSLTPCATRVFLLIYARIKIDTNPHPQHAFKQILLDISQVAIPVNTVDFDDRFNHATDTLRIKAIRFISYSPLGLSGFHRQLTPLKLDFISIRDEIPYDQQVMMPGQICRLNLMKSMARRHGGISVRQVSQIDTPGKR